MKKEHWIVENVITGEQTVYNDFVKFKMRCKILIAKEYDKMFCAKLMDGKKVIDESELKTYFNE